MPALRVHAPRPRKTGGGGSTGGIARPARLPQQRGTAGVPGVRAVLHDGRGRLSGSEARRVLLEPGRESRDGRCAGTIDHAVLRRGGACRRRHLRRRRMRPLRTRRGRRGRGLRRGERRLPRPPDLRHGRYLDGRGAHHRGGGPDDHGDGGGRRAHKAAHGGRAHGERRRRFDRLGRPRRRPARRPPLSRGGTGPRGLRQGWRGADRHGRQSVPRLPRGRG